MVNTASELAKKHTPLLGWRERESGGGGAARVEQAGGAGHSRHGQKLLGLLRAWGMSWGYYRHDKSENHHWLGVGFVPRLGEGYIREKDS